MPLTALWPGSNRHPCQFFPPVVAADPDRPDGGLDPVPPLPPYRRPGHTIIVGPPGAGKSTHLTALVTGWLRYPSSRVYFFDRDHSARLLAKAIGATYYDLGRLADLLPAASSTRQRGRAGGRDLLARGAPRSADPEALATAEPASGAGGPDAGERSLRAPNAPDAAQSGPGLWRSRRLWLPSSREVPTPPISTGQRTLSMTVASRSLRCGGS